MTLSQTTAAAVGVVLAFGAVAGAQTPPGSPGRLFISPMGEPFRADENAPTAPIQIWFANTDLDSDGFLSRAEFVGEAMAFFANTLDADHDRNATSAELTALWRARAPEMLAARTAPVSISPPRRAPNDMGGHGPRDRRDGFQAGDAREPQPQQPRPFMLGAELEPVMSCDADRSRRVDVLEFERCAMRRFASLDSNGDGLFALTESERGRELMDARRRN